MGSFNTTCLASMQTIASGDECYIIPIIKRNSYRPIKISKGEVEFSLHGITDSTCYTTAFWEGLGRPIEAVYDDCGEVIVNDTPENINIIKSFIENNKRGFFKTEEGENSSHDISFDPSLLNVENPIKSIYDMWSATVHEHRVFVSNWNRIPSQFQFAIISKEAFNNLIDMIAKTKDYDGTKNDTESRISRYEKAFKDICDDNGELKPEDDDLITIKSMQFFLVRQLFDRLNNSGESFRLFVDDLLYEIYDELKGQTSFPESVKEKLRIIIRENYMYRGLTELNIKLMPMVYATQDYSNEIGKEYSKFVRKTSAEITKKRKKMYDDCE